MKILPLLVLCSCGFPCLEAAERVALVIGNGNYQNGGRLDNPGNDAVLIGGALEKAGFRVTLRKDLGLAGMRAAVREFAGRLKKGDTALFFYAGHGAQRDGENFLLPVDAPAGMKQYELEDQAYKAGVVLGAMAEAGGTLNIVVLDCCRDNPFARGWRSARQGLAQMTSPPETLIAYSTAPGSVAADGRGANSPYSAALAEELLRPGAKIEDVFKQVARRVDQSTRSSQRPWMASDLLGEFVFVPGAGPKTSGMAVARAGEERQFEIAPGVKLAMCGIPAGSFTMGGSESDETPHKVTLTKSFWLGRTEVTQGQWEAVMGNNPSNFKGKDLPVETVSWDDATEFCDKLNAKGQLPAGWKFALPTEAQWEYACRAGTTGDYAGKLDEMAWYSGNSGRKTHAVGTKKANAWGLYDMHGNVWELCADWYGAYPAGTLTDPTGTNTGVTRVDRGGSWLVVAARCRAAFRRGDGPGYRDFNLGFRPALVPSR